MKNVKIVKLVLIFILQWKFTWWSHTHHSHTIFHAAYTFFFLNLSLYFTIIIMNRMISRTNTSYDYDIDTTYDNPRCSSIMYILYCIRKNLNLISCICLHRGSDDFLSSFCAHMNRMAVCDQYENNFFPRRYGFGGVFARWKHPLLQQIISRPSLLAKLYVRMLRAYAHSRVKGARFYFVETVRFADPCWTERWKNP